MTEVKVPRKLIEVALPLDDINVAAAREKSIRHGHPSTLHLWWARRPLAAARAVIFAQMVNDPGYERYLGRGVNKKEAAKERERLFVIIKKLVQWENTNNEAVLNEARAEIWKSWRETCALNKNHPQAAELFNPDKLPPFHDPFAGGGAIPLEAQRLGLEAFASDLNPVAVFINKTMIEIPPKFAGKAPVNPDAQKKKTLFAQKWRGAQGLAEDVRYYGQWMRDEAEQRIGWLYPKYEITVEMTVLRPDLRKYVGQKLNVIAWLWARTVKSPNPAFSAVDVPLISTFLLSRMSGNEAYIEPVIEDGGYHFEVKAGMPKDSDTLSNGTKLSRGANFRCIMSGTPITGEYVKSEGKAGRMGARLMAVVAEGDRGRVYLPPTDLMDVIARQAEPEWKPEVMISGSTQYLGVKPYGMVQFSQLFTDRQLVALGTFSMLVEEAYERVKRDALSAGMPDDTHGLTAGGNEATAYAQAVASYLAIVVDRLTDYNSALCSWHIGGPTTGTKSRNTFSRQALAMTWDLTEVNPLSNQSGSIKNSIDYTAKSIQTLGDVLCSGVSLQGDARSIMLSRKCIVSTDPPYYDNVPYADLSDFFYVWLRRSMKSVFPELFATVVTPKTDELVAFAYRHDGKAGAEAFFLDGMTQAMNRLTKQTHPGFPVTIYYAFKQSETKDAGTTFTGWETFLGAVLKAGFAISGTWPMRTELGNRMRSSESNALASSIILVCRRRESNSQVISRREFIRELNAVLPEALLEMTRGGLNSPVAPVDLSQAIIGPGMAIFSKYKAVLEADGKPMNVRTALQLINRFLAEDDFDHDTQFCLHWFDSCGWSEGKFGEADVLARAKGTSVDGVAGSGVLESGKGIVRLLRYSEYPNDWTPEKDNRISVWEGLHHLVRVLQTDSASAAGGTLAKMPDRVESIRQLAYRLYTLCERKGWAEDARMYNELIESWQSIESAQAQVEQPQQGAVQLRMDFQPKTR